jgi:hypothetical protein
VSACHALRVIAGQFRRTFTRSALRALDNQINRHCEENYMNSCRERQNVYFCNRFRKEVQIA